MNKEKQKIVVGLSGGLDSSVAMLLLKNQGFEPVGVSLKYDVWQDEANQLKENVCCSKESFEIARHVCEELGVEYHIIDATKDFKKEVVDYFKSELKAKRTPNPCVVCNRVLKFKKLLDFADKNGIEFVATGHYARIDDGKLKKGKDENKDQTYTLSFLDKKWLKRIVFPLGDYTKEQALKIAKKAGFDFYAYRKQSQDFCYVSDKSMKAFLEKEIGIQPGPIKNEQGETVGQHNGLHFYTIGQRKGLEIPNGPYFVTDMDPQNNVLFVTKMGQSPTLFKQTVYLKPYNLLVDDLEDVVDVQAKIRYSQDLCPARLEVDDNRLKLIFDKPQRAVTLGQYAVFYQKETCLGSGRIIEAE